jgi:hypothetical protein
VETIVNLLISAHKKPGVGSRNVGGWHMMYNMVLKSCRVMNRNWNAAKMFSPRNGDVG